MKITKLCIIIFCIVIYSNSNAQQSTTTENKAVSKQKSPKKEGGTKLGISAGIGMASYFGDLTQNNKLFSQAGVSFGLGVTYPLFPKFNGKFDVGFAKVQASDSKNSSTQLKDRNLSFKSNVVDLALSLEYELIDMKKHKFSPYVSAGIGVMFFNPYANSATGQKTFLRDLGTEGQGLNGFPDQYKKAAVTAPVGVGLKYAVTNSITIQLDFNYRITGTDYLDDVSLNYYPDKALLDARNPATSAFTYRGSGSYPAKNNLLSRGNPSNKDGFYTTQFRVTFKH